MEAPGILKNGKNGRNFEFWKENWENGDAWSF
jgi:hypothetical protein